MTVTILSLVCIVLAALCLCLWVYASMANEDLIEAQWKADYYEREANHYASLYHTVVKQRTP
jgi:thiaminase